MRTLEISARFLAPLQIPPATLSRPLHLSALHFPSAKFGERDPPSFLVRLGREHTFILFYSIPVQRAESAPRGRRPVAGGSCATSPVAPSRQLRVYSKTQSHRGKIFFLKR